MDSITDITYNESEIDETLNHPPAGGWFYLLPAILTILLLAGIAQDGSAKEYKKDNQLVDSEYGLKNKHKYDINFAALLANEEFSHNLRDTVYTDRNLWLELRIDQQMLYVHYRDGRTKNYPVSSGNKFLSKGIESRPGLFAIFIKEEVHLSTQFDNARMNYYMPYNMGIGFHGLPNTGYYGNLGVRPSSHGCIRMRNEDARQLFKECDIGTIVLAHRGETARVVAFAPEGFNNESEYTKDDYMKVMAYNLGT
ncbi:MAG TPA: L,D-transpeptidase, partial [Ignavibacteria bacterium]